MPNTRLVGGRCNSSTQFRIIEGVGQQQHMKHGEGLANAGTTAATFCLLLTSTTVTGKSRRIVQGGPGSSNCTCGVRTADQRFKPVPWHIREGKESS